MQNDSQQERLQRSHEMLRLGMERRLTILLRPQRQPHHLAQMRATTAWLSRLTLRCVASARHLRGPPCWERMPLPAARSLPWIGGTDPPGNGRREPGAAVLVPRGDVAPGQARQYIASVVCFSTARHKEAGGDSRQERRCCGRPPTSTNADAADLTPSGDFTLEFFNVKFSSLVAQRLCESAKPVAPGLRILAGSAASPWSLAHPAPRDAGKAKRIRPG
jgi:hypothetical protein